VRRFYPNRAPKPSSAASSLAFSSSAAFFLSSFGFSSAAGAAVAGAGAAAIIVGAALIASSMSTSLREATKAFTCTASTVIPAADKTFVTFSSLISFPDL
jgi:hypothetical protein